MSDAARPQIWIVGGPNGAGKSTLVRRYGRARLEIVNPDDIARRIAPDNVNDRQVQLQAGREAIARRAALLSRRATFLVETTMSGHSEITLMRQAASAGYKVNLVFVGLPLAVISAARVSMRVAEGGHDVSTEDTERRFGRIMANLPAAVAASERVIVLDNSGRRPRLLLVAESGRPPRILGNPPAWLAALLPGMRLPGAPAGG